MKKEQLSYRRLWRSRKERKIAGVCGGLADYFKVDPFWIRFIFVIFFLAGGAAFIVYLIMWFMIPLEPESTKKRVQQTD